MAKANAEEGLLSLKSDLDILNCVCAQDWVARPIAHKNGIILFLFNGVVVRHNFDLLVFKFKELETAINELE